MIFLVILGFQPSVKLGIIEIKKSKIKEALQKTRDYIQPISCITLGHKTTSFEFLKRSLSLLLTYILPITLFGGLMLTNVQMIIQCPQNKRLELIVPDALGELKGMICEKLLNLFEYQNIEGKWILKLK